MRYAMWCFTQSPQRFTTPAPPNRHCEAQSAEAIQKFVIIPFIIVKIIN